jgi:protein phosphatase 2C family protein 2/3
LLSINRNPELEAARVSSQNPISEQVLSYGANTHNGIIRTYNEDRISIVLDLKNPNSKQAPTEKKITFFAIFDGHGGSGCSEFLRDNLHNLIAASTYFPSLMEQAIIDGCN